MLNAPDATGWAKCLAAPRTLAHDMSTTTTWTPYDFGEQCPKCLGSGTVEYDLNEDADDE